MAQDLTTVSVRMGRKPYSTEVSTDSHSFLMDVDASKGGGDSGPDPHELLLASLGACTVMTVKMYADRKGWPIDSIDAKASHATERTDEGMRHRFVVDMTIKGDLDEEQRARLIDIAHRCPIHRALVEPKSVEIRG